MIIFFKYNIAQNAIHANSKYIRKSWMPTLGNLKYQKYIILKFEFSITK